VGQIFFQWFSVFSTGNTGAVWRENGENDPKGNQMILAKLLPPVAVGYRVWVIWGASHADVAAPVEC